MADNGLEKLAIEKKTKEKKVRGRSGSPLRILLIAGVVLLVFLMLWMYFSKGTQVTITTVSEVFPSQILSKLNASGYVVAQRKADVATKTTGQLVSIMVQEGSVVREGQVIARLENDDARARVSEMEANLTLARARLEEAKATSENTKTDFERMKKLVKTGAVSKSEFDAARTRYLTAEASVKASDASVRAGTAALQSADVSLSYTEIKAPFDAVVLTKNADVGDIITPLGSAANAKAAVVTIADLSSLQVEADVSESNIGMVSAGQPCDITLDALPGVRFQGVVDTIVPTVDRTKATVLVKVIFLKSDPRILPEMSAKVGFLSRLLRQDEMRPRVMVSSSALRGAGEDAHVFVVRGDKAVEAPVMTGVQLGGMVEVRKGLKPGDVVVSNPPEKLKDGAKIEVLEK